MNFQQWYLKTFKKEQIVRLIYTGEDKRVKTLFVIPDEGDVIHYNGQAFLLKPELVYFLNGIPTVQATHKSADLVDIYDTTKTKYTAKEFSVAVKPVSNGGKKRSLF